MEEEEEKEEEGLFKANAVNEEKEVVNSVGVLWIVRHVSTRCTSTMTCFIACNKLGNNTHSCPP